MATYATSITLHSSKSVAVFISLISNKPLRHWHMDPKWVKPNLKNSERTRLAAPAGSVLQHLLDRVARGRAKSIPRRPSENVAAHRLPVNVGRACAFDIRGMKSWSQCVAAAELNRRRQLRHRVTASSWPAVP